MSCKTFNAEMGKREREKKHAENWHDAFFLMAFSVVPFLDCLSLICYGKNDCCCLFQKKNVLKDENKNPYGELRFE